MLGGAVCPSRSAWGSIAPEQEMGRTYWLYGGVPPKPLKELSQELEYFGGPRDSLVSHGGRRVQAKSNVWDRFHISLMVPATPLTLR